MHMSPLPPDPARALRLIGLGARARKVAAGVDAVRNAVVSGKAHLAIVATDASRHGIEKVVPLVKRRGITMIETASAAALGAAVGRPATTAVAVLDDALARGVAEAFGVRDNKVE